MRVEAEHFRVRVGGNYFVDVGSLVAFDGQPLFHLTRRDSDNELGIDFDVHDATGKKVAVIRNSKVVSGDASAFDITRSADRHEVREKKSGKVIASVTRRVDGVALDVNLRTYLPDGRELVATPDAITLPSKGVGGGIVFSDNLFQGLAVGIAIGRNTVRGGTGVGLF